MKQIASKSCSFLQKGWTTRMLIKCSYKLEIYKKWLNTKSLLGALVMLGSNLTFGFDSICFKIFWHLRLNSQQFSQDLKHKLGSQISRTITPETNADKFLTIDLH